MKHGRLWGVGNKMKHEERRTGGWLNESGDMNVRKEKRTGIGTAREDKGADGSA